MKATKKSKTIEAYQPQMCIAGKIARCERIVSQIYRKHLSKFGITQSQLSILSVVAKKKGPVNQRLLSELLYLEKSTVSRNLKRLFLNDYLKRGENSVLLVTRKGARLLEKVIPEWEIALEETRSVLKKDGESAVDLVIARLTNN